MPHSSSWQITSECFVVPCGDDALVFYAPLKGVMARVNEPMAAALAFFKLASEPKKIEWPDSWESARQSRQRWLGELLGFE